MPTADEVADAVLANAIQPQTVEGDMGKVSEYSMTDQIAAATFAAAQSANNRSGIKFRKIVPPDSNGM